jgi:hypothetical protein
MRGWVVVALTLSLAACQPARQRTAAPVETPRPSPTIVEATPTPTPSPTNKWVTERPPWLGERVLPLRGDGFGEVQPTPKILRNRRFATIDLFPPPTQKRFFSDISPVPRKVATRSSWRSDCPVTLDQLAYIKMPFWGFDHERHTGEMIVNASVAEVVATAFAGLYEAHYPIEEMRVVSRKEVESWNKTPTGDVNVTSSFECRDAAQSSHWSQHAYGLAIDINPFHNPYIRGDLVAPELASAYVDRSWMRPGMILEGDRVIQAFDSIGWGWGGRWSSLKDYMHFSQNGH